MDILNKIELAVQKSIQRIVESFLLYLGS